MIPEYLYQGILGGIATTFIIGLVGIIAKPIRDWLFYEFIEYNLEYDSDFGSCRWDIQWELERFAIVASDVHNDYLENVEIKLNQAATWSTKDSKLFVSRKWYHPNEWPVGFRLRSIVRTKPEKTVNEFALTFDIRKRRKWF